MFPNKLLTSNKLQYNLNPTLFFKEQAARVKLVRPEEIAVLRHTLITHLDQWTTPSQEVKKRETP